MDGLGTAMADAARRWNRSDGLMPVLSLLALTLVLALTLALTLLLLLMRPEDGRDWV